MRESILIHVSLVLYLTLPKGWKQEKVNVENVFGSVKMINLLYFFV